jgi:hypothetical protein
METRRPLTRGMLVKNSALSSPLLVKTDSPSKHLPFEVRG